MKKNILSLIVIMMTFFPHITNAYYYLSPYCYCGNNPVNCVDPTGCVVEGATKKDAALAVEDFRAMFPGDEFANFRNLIMQSGKKQNGKALAPISEEALAEAVDVTTLNEDQQALMDMVVNTINSKDIHKVEYSDGKGVLSNQATEAFLPGFMNGALGHIWRIFLKRMGGYHFHL